MNVIPLSKVDSVVHEAAARVLNGLIRLKKAGVHVDMPQSIDISLNVSPDAGINAVRRDQVQGASVRHSTVSTAEQVSTSTKGPTGSTVETTGGGQATTESSQQVTTGNDVQGNRHGRVTEFEVLYEE